jgi:hypothetical protein
MWKRFVLGLLFSLGCSPGHSGTNGQPHDLAGLGDGGGPTDQCLHPPMDSDGDGISDQNEGRFENPPRDTDKDGTADYLDQDSDNDGILDAIEGRNPTPCDPPIDSDQDGKPDFEDLDSDSATDSTVPDAEEAGDPMHPIDSDGDGQADYLDPDDDGDGILDVFEMTANGSSVAATSKATAPDTNGDGIPDYLDVDSDGDTILDRDEGLVDTNGNFIPNYRDLDSDGDCISDQKEAGRADRNQPPVDTNLNGVPDFEDVDSDGDGLIDHLEDKNCNGVLDACETDRLKTDTDGDGVNDLIEYEDCAVKTPAQQMALMCQCDGSNPNSSPLTHGDFVFVVDYMMPPTPAQETLSLSTDVSQADVVFSLDTTGSMNGSLTNLAGSLAGYVPTIQMKVKSIAFGIVEYRDFDQAGQPPISGFVTKYDHQIMTVNTAAGIASIQTVLNGMTNGYASGGGDSPEAEWESLYSIGLGAPLTVQNWNSQMSSAAPGTPPPGESFGSLGYMGFRVGSVPIVVECTDAEGHDAPGVPTNGEDGLNDYGSGTTCDQCSGVPTRQQALGALNNIGAHVVGLAGIGGGASGDPKTRAIATAQATGAVVSPSDFGPVGVRPGPCAVGQCCTGQGGASEAPLGGQCPLAFSFDDSSGMGVSDAVVSGIVALANGLRFDIHVQAVDVDPKTVDNFMLKLVPNLSGVGPAAMCITVTPSPLQDNYMGPHALPGPDGIPDTFPGIGGGNHICFDVVPKMNTAVPDTDQPQFFRAQLQVKGVTGGNTVNLGTPRDVFFLVPPQIKNGPIN